MSCMASAVKDKADAAPSHRNIFPFLELPRELRDMIYEHGLDDHEMGLKCGILLRATDTANIAFLTVNRQIREEYQERVNNTAILRLNDSSKFHFETFDLPAGAARVPTLELNITALVAGNLTPSEEDNREDKEVCHKRWVTDVLAKQHALEKLSVNVNFVFISQRITRERVRDTLNESFWSGIPQLSSLHVYDIQSGDIYVGRERRGAHWRFDREDRMVLKWSAETREVESVEEDIFRRVQG